MSNANEVQPLQSSNHVGDSLNRCQCGCACVRVHLLCQAPHRQFGPVAVPVDDGLVERGGALLHGEAQHLVMSALDRTDMHFFHTQYISMLCFPNTV